MLDPETLVGADDDRMFVVYGFDWRGQESPIFMELVADALRMISPETWAQSERDRERLQVLHRRIRKQISTAYDTYDDRVKERLQASMFDELSDGWQLELEDQFDVARLERCWTVGAQGS